MFKKTDKYGHEKLVALAGVGRALTSVRTTRGAGRVWKYISDLTRLGILTLTKDRKEVYYVNIDLVRILEG